jgi:hypothetical protein
MKRVFIVLIALAGTISASSHAAIMIFSDRPAFMLATGATGIGSIPDTVPGAGFSLGGLNFTNEPGSSFNSDRNWSTLIDEAFDLAINDVENFNIDSVAPLYSFGFDFHEPTTPSPSDPNTCNATCSDSEFIVTLKNGGALVDSFMFNGPDDMLAFVGVTSTDPFDRIEIRDHTDTIDNEFFGNFLTGTTRVPEPGTLALIGLGLLGFVLRRPGNKKGATLSA